MAGTLTLARLAADPSSPSAGAGSIYLKGASDAAIEAYFKRPDATVLTLAHLEGAQTFTGALTLTDASPQLTLGVLNTTSGGILMYGSTSGSLTLKPAAAAGAGVTITLPATSVTLNAAADLTGLGTGVATALAIAIGSAGAPVTFNGALGTPSSGVLSNLTGTLNALVTASSLTSLGTITSGIWNAGFVTVNNSAATASQSITASGSTTARVWGRISNTSGMISWGVEGSAGGQMATGAAAYASVIGSDGATSLHLYTSGIVRQTIDSTGAVTIPGTLGVTGAITGTLGTAAQPNITSLGTISALVAGTVTASGIIRSNETGGNQLTLNNVTGANSRSNIFITINDAASVATNWYIGSNVNTTDASLELLNGAGTGGIVITKAGAINLGYTAAGAVTIPGTLGVTGAITGASYSGGAISGTTGAFSDVVTITRAAGVAQFKVVATGADQLQIVSQAAGIGAIIQAANNGATLYAPLTLIGTTLSLSISGTEKLGISATGAVTIPGTLGVTGAITGGGYSGGAISGTTGAFSSTLTMTASANIRLDTSPGGAIFLAPSVASAPSMRMPHGTAPSAPSDGDMWTTTAGLFIRINGSTVGPLS